MLRPLDVGDDITLHDVAAALGVDFHQTAADGSGHFHYLTPRSLDVAEGVALLVFFADIRLDCRGALAFAVELPVDLALDGGGDGIGLGMFECCNLLGREFRTQFGILCLLQVGEL